MTSHTSKIAVSLPAQTLRSVETARRRLGRSRSSVVAEALDAWVAAQSSSAADRAYLAAYARQPEPAEEVLATSVVAAWAPWDGEPTPAAPRSKARAKVTTGRRAP
jgi:hypothetical protein